MEEARLMKAATEAQKENLENLIMANFEKEWFNYSQSKRDSAHFKSQIVKAGQAINILVQAYSTGGKDFEEILRMQRQVLKFKLELIKTQTIQNKAVAKIEALYSKF